MPRQVLCAPPPTSTAVSGVGEGAEATAGSAADSSAFAAPQPAGRLMRLPPARRRYRPRPRRRPYARSPRATRSTRASTFAMNRAASAGPVAATRSGSPRACARRADSGAGVRTTTTGSPSGTARRYADSSRSDGGEERQPNTFAARWANPSSRTTVRSESIRAARKRSRAPRRRTSPRMRRRCDQSIGEPCERAHDDQHEARSAHREREPGRQVHEPTPATATHARERVGRQDRIDALGLQAFDDERGEGALSRSNRSDELDRPHSSPQIVARTVASTSSSGRSASMTVSGRSPASSAEIASARAARSSAACSGRRDPGDRR